MSNTAQPSRFIDYVIGVFFGWGAAVASYYVASELETPGPHRVPSVIVLLHRLGGKWGCVIPFVGIAILFTVLSIREWRRERGDPHKPPDAA